MKKLLVSGAMIIVALFVSQSVFAQCKGWEWPEDGEQKARAEEKKVLYEDALRNGQFKQASAPLFWLLTNTPKLNTSIYINGAEIYEKLADQEKDAAKKQVYADSLLKVYDLRIANCGEEANVIQRKAFASFKYNINGPRATEVLPLMDRAIELNGNDVFEAIFIPYMQTVRVITLKNKSLTDEQVLQRYDNIMSIIDAQIKRNQSQGKPVDKLLKAKDDIDALLVTIVKVDCDFVKKNLAPKYKANPSDLTMAKKIFQFMLVGKCTDDPLWLEAGEAIYRGGEKDFGLAKNIGLRYLAMENYEKADFFLKEAIGIAPSPSDKADVHMYLGSLESRKKNKVAAREQYRQAIAADGSRKDAYEKIGDLYYGSMDDCAQRDNMADDRAVFLIAYDMYQRAGESKKMAQAKEQFPSKEEIFLKNYVAGGPITVRCWINESTTIRTRD